MTIPRSSAAATFAPWVALAVWLAPHPVPAQPASSSPQQVQAAYQKHEYEIPMRDGISLFTAVYTPRDSSRQYPILLARTPYGVAPYGPDAYPSVLRPGPEYQRAGYIFVYQDVRGRFHSGGTFVQMTPHRDVKHGPKDIDESTDTYDTIDWLIHHVAHNNGRVGLWGISYGGFFAAAGAIDAHPALKAVSPQAPVTDWFRGDDFHHNGALFLADAFDFESGFGVRRPAPTNARTPGLEHFKPDEYRFFLDSVGPLPTIDTRYFHHEVPFWDSLVAHPTYDAFWRERTPIPHLHDVQPAVLVVGGWFDAEDLWGTLNVYHAVARSSPSARLVMGPWFHAGWFLTDGGTFADLVFPTKTADDYHDQVELPFFEHYLKDKGDLAPWAAFVYETGADRWRTFDAWPPPGVTTRTFYLQPGHGLASDRPQAGAGATAGFDAYRSDPAHPVPYMEGIQSERPAEYMARDQRFASERPDVVAYESAPLREPLVIAGPIRADLYVSTSGTDADWVVKLIDVYPDDTPNPAPNPRGVVMGGYQQLVRAQVMRGKFRSSLEHPRPFVPGQVTPVTIALDDAFHEFKPGHRIMVQIQSSWFPLVDRNPQRFVDIYQATAADFQPAEQRVYHTATAPSAVVLSVLLEH